MLDLKASPTADGTTSVNTETPITIARGDGIGPEIMAATLDVLSAAGARLQTEAIEIGERLYRAGHSSGIASEAWESLRRTRVFLKAPITTPSGSGYKSLNVTIRKTLGLYANVRPCISYPPHVGGGRPAMDVVIVRENEEDLYAGIEHRQTDQVVQCLKLISRPGCQRVIRYAFEYARCHGRQRVTCMVKDNIMKMTDGLFYALFEEIGAEYPDIARDRAIIDIGAARLASRPERFDVIVTPNLYGDIISDVAAEISGSVGLAGSANIGEHIAMFEAIHGSAPDIAGRGVANPSGLLQSAVMMLIHIGQPAVATRVHNAWLSTIEDGLHTADIAHAGSRAILGTNDFAAAVIERLGRRPQQLRAVDYVATAPRASAGSVQKAKGRTRQVKQLVGIDVFVCADDRSPGDLGDSLQRAAGPGLELRLITNRGVKVWPQGFPETLLTDHWRCRFVATGPAEPQALLELQRRVLASGVEVIKTEHLYNFDGVPGYALAQGE